MPVYNGEKYISQALDSLLAQTFKDFELIISDNGSTDKTESICRSYTARDKRIKFHREEINRGACWNFNRVFELSRSRYFKWAAADDICAPTFLSSCFEVLENDSSVVCCHTKTQKIDQNGQILKNLPDPTDGGLSVIKLRKAGRSSRIKPDATAYQKHRRFRDVLLSSGWGIRCYGLIRAGTLSRTNMILPYYGYEKVLMAELSLLGRFHIVPETLFFERFHKEASSNLTSVAEQLLYFNPQIEGYRTFPRFKFLKGYVRAVGHFPLNIKDRLLCYIWIVNYLFQVTKWKNVLLNYIKREGTEGGSHHILENLEKTRN